MENRLSYDVVIATRNRPEALAISIPLLLEQSRLPEKIIVVDSSDDHATVADAVTAATVGWDGLVHVMHSEKGLTYQRNVGLAETASDIVMFPDDDSLFFPGTAEAIMQVYERDVDGQVAAVCGVATSQVPQAADLGKSYEMTQAHQKEMRFAELRRRVDALFPVANPLKEMGQILLSKHPKPDWLSDDLHVPVEYMTGYRMTFRRAPIQACGFDEVMKGYSLGEDVDASFGVFKFGMILGARKAPIYHHKFPSGRDNGFRRGAIAIFNRVYIARKHLCSEAFTEQEKRHIGRRLKQFVRAKRAQAWLRLVLGKGRDEARGTIAAARAAWPMHRATLPQLAGAYENAKAQVGL